MSGGRSGYGSIESRGTEGGGPRQSRRVDVNAAIKVEKVEGQSDGGGDEAIHEGRSRGGYKVGKVGKIGKVKGQSQGGCPVQQRRVGRRRRNGR